MTNIELLECAQSVYDFLKDVTDNIYPLQIKSNKTFDSFMVIPAFKKMNDTLTKYEFVKHPEVLSKIWLDQKSDEADMVSFTLTLNGVLKIYEQNDFRKLLKNKPKDFFSSKESLDFYRIVLRELKLNLCLS